MNKKSFEHPEIGAFYLVPDPKTGKYTITSAYDKPGKDSTHFFLWAEVVKILKQRFKKAKIDKIKDSYTGIPRGRVSMTLKNTVVVLHGDDFPLVEYKSDIMSEYKLHDTHSIGKLSWAFEPHESMGSAEKGLVEDTLGIEISKTGFKIKEKK